MALGVKISPEARGQNFSGALSTSHANVIFSLLRLPFHQAFKAARGKNIRGFAGQWELAGNLLGNLGLKFARNPNPVTLTLTLALLFKEETWFGTFSLSGPPLQASSRVVSMSSPPSLLVTPVVVTTHPPTSQPAFVIHGVRIISRKTNYFKKHWSFTVNYHATDQHTRSSSSP